MAAFRDFFTAPVWDHVLVLVTGAVLSRGRRTVSAVLRIMGLSQATDFALYHHVLSQARWDSRAIARTTPALLGLFSLITLWAAEAKATFTLNVRTAAWYAKEQPTFSDAIATVRRVLWTTPNLPISR